MSEVLTLEEEQIEHEFTGEHAATCVEGLLDTVAGNEAYNGGELTYAQQYLKCVMEADGMSFARVHGTEGMIDKIKEGAFKAWEAIKRAFKAIWSFFFDKKIERQAKQIFDTAKEFRQTAESRMKGYKGEVSKESIQKRFTMIEELEKMLDTKSAEAVTLSKELDKDIYIQKPFFKILKEGAEEIKKTYGLMEVFSNIHKPSDLSGATTKLEEIVKKIVAAQEKVRNAKSAIDVYQSAMEDDLKGPTLNRDALTRALNVMKICAKIFDIYINCTQRKLNTVTKLISNLERLFPKAAAE